MKTKINLYEVPVTEVFDIVREETIKAIENCPRIFGEVDKVHISMSIKMIAATSQYILPTDVMLKYLTEDTTIEEFEESVINYAKDSLHKNKN